MAMNSPRPLAPRVHHLIPSATLAVKARAEQLCATGIDVLNFTAGEPDTAPAPHILEAAQRAIVERKHYYTPSAGIGELRQAISDTFTAVNHIPTTPDRVIVTNGGKEALYLIFQTLLSDGDEVIIASPTWVSFAEQIRLAGGVAVSAASDEQFHLVAESIALHVTKRTVAVILNSPANPTGAVLSQQEIEAVAALAQQHNMWVISDEVYEHFLYDGRTHTSIASLPDMAERTITVNACSKTHSMTGWRVGYATGPAAVIAAMSKLKDHQSSNVNAVAQYAALAALTGLQEHVEQMRRTFEQRRDVLVKGSNAIPGLHLSAPEGAFYGFINAQEMMVSHNISSSIALCDWLLDTARVAVVPGEAFGAEWTTYIRWSFAADQRTIEEGMRRIAAIA